MAKKAVIWKMAQSGRDHYFESVTSREAGMCHTLMHPVLILKIIYIFILRITHIHNVKLLPH